MAYDKRYQVFVSSTYLDLKEERHAVIMALLQLNAVPSGMELFPAADDDAWTLIKSVIEDCDYYLLVVGGKYGSVDPVEDISYTEKEYDYAVSCSKPVMAFLHADPDLIPQGKAEKAEEAQRKLAAFRSKVQRMKHVKYWSGPDELAGKVALSFSQFAKNYPALGWVRADQQTSSETLAEINELRKRITEMQFALDRRGLHPPLGQRLFPKERMSSKSGCHIRRSTLCLEARQRTTGGVMVNSTWDDVFSGLGPVMLDESREDALADQLNDWARGEYLLDIREHLVESVGFKGDASKVSTYGTKVKITGPDFHTILIQLLALGLVAQSERRRSVADKGTYWTLTPYGRTRLIQLRALRKSSETEPQPLPTPPE